MDRASYEVNRPDKYPLGRVRLLSSLYFTAVQQSAFVGWSVMRGALPKAPKPAPVLPGVRALRVVERLGVGVCCGFVECGLELVMVVSDKASKSLGISEHRLPPHELRHTAASLAVAEGANVEAVQRMLGHASAAMTLDVYADLFEDDLDQVADRLDQAVTARSAD